MKAAVLALCGAQWDRGAAAMFFRTGSPLPAVGPRRMLFFVVQHLDKKQFK